MSGIIREGRGRRCVAEAGTYSNGDSSLSVEFLQLLNVTGKKGLLDEERLVGLKSTGKLLREGLVDTAVEVESDVDADRLDLCETLDGRLEGMWGVEPRQLEQFG